jgi:hypothetical protein
MSRASLAVLLLLALLWLALGNVGQAVPPRAVVIQAGPEGGSFDQHAQRYAQALRSAEVAVQVRNVADTLSIPANLAQPSPRVDVGFTALPVPPQEFPTLRSAGVVELQPLFVFHRAALGAPASPQALAGLRLVMPPPGSASAKAALQVLAEYGVTPDNARVTHLPLGEAVAALRRGEHDAGFFMLAPANAMIAALATDPGLRPLPLAENLALSRRLDGLKPVLLARGAFGLKPALPAQDLPMVAARVEVIVREDIHPAVLYPLLQAMKDTHRGQTLVSPPGEFPSATGTVLPLHPLAADWGRDGTPWLYEHLPALPASLIDTYWAPLLALLAAISAVSTLHSLDELVHGTALWLLGIALRVQRWRLARGGVPGRSARAMFAAAESLMAGDAGHERLRQTLDALRPHLAGGAADAPGAKALNAQAPEAGGAAGPSAHTAPGTAPRTAPPPAP